MRYIFILFAISTSLISCQIDNKKLMPLFSVIGPSHTGIHFKNELKETEYFNIIEYLYFNNGAGVAVGDINNDNLNDIYFTSNQNTNKLYLNKGNLKFEDITGKAGVS